MKFLPNRLAILIYHRVLARPDPMRPGVPDAGEFAWQLATLSRWFNVMPLDRGIDALRAGTLPLRAVAITFDDGYADNFEVALPMLQRFDLTASFFIATGFLDGGAMWNDQIIDALSAAPGPVIDLKCAGLGQLPFDGVENRQRSILSVIRQLKHLPDKQRTIAVTAICDAFQFRRDGELMMRPEQVRALHDAGMQIGGHTVSHPILTRQPAAVARQEIETCRVSLEGITGGPVSGFAYPNGRPGDDYDASHVAAVRAAGFEYALSTAWGAARPTSDNYQLPRLALWDKTPARFAARILRGLYLQGAAQSA